MSAPAPHRPPRVAVLATLDTKGQEALFLSEEIRALGLAPLLIDIGLSGTSPADADINHDDLVARGAIAASDNDRSEAMETTAAAATTVLRDLVTAGDLAGVVGIGGGTGGWIAQRAVEPLPLGFPKLVVTTVVKSSGEHDVLFMPSVVDVAGLNGPLRTVLRQAAAAICGMASREGAPPAPARPAIAMTMFGVTTEGGTVARSVLEDAGYEVVVFHATGAGGRTMERLVRDGYFTGVLDWTTTELVQNVAGGLCDAGADRLRAAAAAGVPQVVVPGAVDVINVHPPIPEAFADRPRHWHLPTVPLIRSTAAENTAVGAWVGDRLREAAAPTAVLVPQGGFSALDITGGTFEDQGADRAFVDAVRATGGDGVRVDVSSHHINDQAFAREAADLLLSFLDPAPLNPITEKE